MDGYHVMFPVGYRHRVLEAFLVDEIRQNEGRASAFHDVGQVFQPYADVCAPTFRLEIQQLADDEKYMLSPFFGGDELLNVV